MWVLSLLIWLSFSAYGYWIATIKRRNAGHGAVLGLLLGPIGCVVAATLRERPAEEVEQERERAQQEAEERAEAERQWQARLRVEQEKVRKESEARAEAARIRRAEAWDRFAAWFDETVLKFGWFKALPDVAQPIVVGLMIALPLVLLMFFLFGGR